MAEVGSQFERNYEGSMGGGKWTPDAARTAWGNWFPQGRSWEMPQWDPEGMCGLAKSLHLPPMGSVCGEARAGPQVQMAVASPRALSVP